VDWLAVAVTVGGWMAAGRFDEPPLLSPVVSLVGAMDPERSSIVTRKLWKTDSYTFSNKRTLSCVELGPDRLIVNGHMKREI
jgi:hypothetical protein